MKIHKIKNIALLVGVAIFLSACSTKSLEVNPKFIADRDSLEANIFSNKQGRFISLFELAKEVEHYPVIFVGDYHNTKQTHEFFNDFLQKLAKKGYNLHLANEWFYPEHNEMLKLYTDGYINSVELRERRNWDKFTRFDWGLVEPLYESVKHSNGKLYGINISRESRAKISLREFDKMSKKEREFFDNLDLNVTAHKALVMPYLDHCEKMPKRSDEPCRERMYRVQVTWDTYMAKESAKIAQEVIKTKKDKLIIFAGAMHMEYGLGIPLRFARLSNLPFYIISNMQYGNEEKLEIKKQKADSIFLYQK
jgi:uncharacterized iron-regulated protein